MALKNEKRRKFKEAMQLEMDSDENFAFIAGYTSGGVPYGITWEEMKEIEAGESSQQAEKAFGDQEELPF